VSEGAASASWSVIGVAGNLGRASAGRFLYWRCEIVLRRLHRAKPIHICMRMPHCLVARLPDLAGAGKLGVAVVVRCMGLDAYFTEQVGGIAGEYCASGCRRVLSRAVHVICISEEVRRHGS